MESPKPETRPLLVAWTDGSEFHENPSFLKAAELSRQATAALHAGDFDAAVAALRNERAIMDRVDFLWGAAKYVRLPLYLQRAGRSIEAWAEFLSLFDRFAPSAGPLRFFNHWDTVRIYDKARLFMTRERRPALAACYAVGHYLAEAAAIANRAADRTFPLSLRREDRVVFTDMLSADSIGSVLGPHLKRAGLLDRLSDLAAWAEFTLSSLPLPSHAVLIDQIRGVLGVTESYPQPGEGLFPCS